MIVVIDVVVVVVVIIVVAAAAAAAAAVVLDALLNEWMKIKGSWAYKLCSSAQEKKKYSSRGTNVEP